MASEGRYICSKNYQNLIIGFQVTVKNVGNVFLETQCTTRLMPSMKCQNLMDVNRVTATVFYTFSITIGVAVKFNGCN